MNIHNGRDYKHKTKKIYIFFATYNHNIKIYIYAHIRGEGCTQTETIDT